MVDYRTREVVTTRGDETKNIIIITLVMTAVFLVTLVVLEATTVEKASLEESAEASIVLNLVAFLECRAVWRFDPMRCANERTNEGTNASFRVSPRRMWGGFFQGKICV